MVSDAATALRALHQALVAARNIGRQASRNDPIADIVDQLERIPIFIAEPDVDRTAEVAEVFRLLGVEYEECLLAANTASTLLRR